MSAIGGAGLTKLGEIANNTDEVELMLSDVNINLDNIETVVTNPTNGYEFYAYEDTGTYVYIMSQNANDA
jgi:hypothetical protein